MSSAPLLSSILTTYSIFSFSEDCELDEHEEVVVLRVKMVSVHSTYNHPDHPHAHAHQYVKKRRKEPRNVDQKVDYPDVKNRTSWASASLARSLIREVNKVLSE